MFFYALKKLCFPLVAIAVLIGTQHPLSSGRSVHAASPSDVAKTPSTDSAATGSISGRIFYKADPKRIWRYSRYYIKDRKKGYVGEAVVGLQDKRLRQPPIKPSVKRPVIDQRDHRFIPETLAIRAGEMVRFTNSDAQVHNVYSLATRNDFDFTLASRGERDQQFKRAVPLRRPVELGCRLHSPMRAWVYIFDHPHFTVTGADGQFHLKGLAPGKYSLEMYHAAGRLHWQAEVEVKAGKDSRQDIRVSPDDRVK